MNELKTITTGKGTYNSFPDKTARSELTKKLARPETAQVGDYLRIKSIGADGTMEVEAVPAPTTEIPADPNFSTVTLGGDSGVVVAPGGAADAPVLALRGAQGEASVRLSNVEDATDDLDAPNLGQVKALMQQLEVVKLAVVASLPETGDEKTLYLVPAANEGDLYAEYLYINGAWEIVGSQRLDLTGYATEAYVDAVPAVRYAEQTLTEEQQMQARANLGVYNKQLRPLTILEGDPMSASVEYNDSLEEGLTYVVELELVSSGVTLSWKLTCDSAYDPATDIDMRYIGNGNMAAAAVGFEYTTLPDTGEPFAVYYSDGINVAFDESRLEQVYRIGVYKMRVLDPANIVPVYEKIPDEFLPDDLLRDADLDGAVNDALAQAKERGEFDGAPGADGLPGADGEDGYTPVKGVDYYTSEDKAEFSAYIAAELAKRGQLKPEFANSVEECTDTSKLYVLPDGMIYAYMEITVAGGAPLFTNLADPASADWQADRRFSSSSGSISECTGSIVSNVITAKKGDTIRVQGLRDGTAAATANAYAGLMGYSDEAGSAKVFSQPMYFYKTRTQNAGGVKDLVTTEGDAVVYPAFQYFDTTDAVIEHASSGSVVCIRVSGEPVTTVDDIIVTVNEAIAYSEGSTGYAWRSTGHAFVPADYEDRIVAVEALAADHTVRIAELETVVEDGLEAALTDAEKLAKIKYWDKPAYDPSAVTLIADDRVKPALTAEDRTIDAIYAKYRALMAQYPNHVTETNLGPCTASDTFEAIDILRFDIRTPDGLRNTGYDLYERKPKLLFLSGIHNEWVGVWGLYYAIEELITNPEFADVLRNVHIIVIPCANPYGLVMPLGEYNTPSHVNANGVAPHNNFEVEWVLRGAVGDYNYSGTEPLSELETQYVDKVMSENADAVAFVSCHNNDYDTEYGAPVIWASSATAHMCNVAFRLIDKISAAWLDKYSDTLIEAIDTYRTEALPEGEYRLGRAQLSTSAGTEARQATKYGIQGVNLEISRMMKVFSGDTDGSSEVMTHGAEVYANLMRTLLTVYDYTDKEAYYR